MGLAAFGRDTHRKARHRGFVWGMYVAPEARGRGVGRALLRALIAHARSRGVERLTLGVATTNHAARELYRASGFVTYGVEPQAYMLDGEYRDSELMTLALESAGERLQGAPD